MSCLCNVCRLDQTGLSSFAPTDSPVLRLSFSYWFLEQRHAWTRLRSGVVILMLLLNGLKERWGEFFSLKSNLNLKSYVPPLFFFFTSSATVNGCQPARRFPQLNQKPGADSGSRDIKGCIRLSVGSCWLLDFSYSGSSLDHFGFETCTVASTFLSLSRSHSLSLALWASAVSTGGASDSLM